MRPGQQGIGGEHHHTAKRGAFHAAAEEQIGTIEHNPAARVRATKKLAQEELIEWVGATDDNEFDVSAGESVCDIKQNGFLRLRVEFAGVAADTIVLGADGLAEVLLQRGRGSGLLLSGGEKTDCCS
jgi:hypothetical protein